MSANISALEREVQMLQSNLDGLLMLIDATQKVRPWGGAG